jgi:hypothetical protein
MRSARSSVARRGSVLVSDHDDGNSRSAVAAVRALDEAGYSPVVTVAARRSAAGASRSCAGVLRVPPVGTPGYRKAVQEYVAATPGAVVLAASDAVLIALDLSGAALVDKAWLPQVVVQPFAVGTMRAVCGVLADGRLLAAVHQTYVRIWPPDCGTASAAITTEPDHDLEERLPHLLAGHVGVFQVQLIGDQVIDVNPRVYGSLPLAVAAGANLPAIACQAITGRHPSGLVRGRPGVRYRWLEGDVRRVLHDARTGALTLGAAGRALAPRRGTAHSVESLRDPGPALVRLAAVARSLA